MRQPLLVPISLVASLCATTPLYAQSNAPQDQSKPAPERIAVENLMPSAGERFLRSLQFAYGLSDVADFKVIDDVFASNPDDSLWKSTVTLRGDALFRNASDYKTALSTLADNVNTFAAPLDVADPFVDARSGDHIVDRVSRGRKKDLAARFFGAITASASWSDRAQLDTFGLTEPPDPNDTSKFSMDVTFDAARLFRTASDRKAGYDALGSYLKLFPGRAPALSIGTPCNGTARDCIGRIAGLTGGSAWVASLIPTFKLESIDEFDYATVGGQPILFPKTMADGILTTYTFTWDLQKIFKGTEMRAEAMNAYRSYASSRDLLRKAAIEVAITPITLRAGEFQVVQLAASSPSGTIAAKDVVWKRPDQGRWIDGLYMTADGQLVGVPRCSGTCDAIDLVVTYGVERKPIAARVTIQP